MKRLATLLAALLVAPLASAQTPTQTISADITSNTTWSSNEVYLLDGLIFVRPGATLTIEAGTVIKGKEVPSAATGDLASGLVVMVNADIEANGEADNPIIFTAEADNVAIADDTDENDRGLWGGVVILGRSTTNSTPGINNVEGIPASDDTRFGCDNTVSGFECDEEDDSGHLRYVSVRHAGFGFETDSEINGITFGAVGSGTEVEYVEVFANSDDAFEFFGGTVRAKYLIGAFNGDDTFDTDRGFRGAFQFGFSINNPGNDAGRCFENDGGVSSLGGEDATPFAQPIYSNITCIGAGEDATDSELGEDENSAALQLRDNTGGKIYNSIFADYPGSAVNLEALGSGEDTENRFGRNQESDDLTIRNNYFFGFDAGTTFAALTDDDSDNSATRQAEIESDLAAANSIADPMIVAYGSREQDGSLDPRLAFGSAAASAADFGFDALDDDFFTEVDFIGAFGPTSNGFPFWAAGWSALDTMGYLNGDVTVANEDDARAVAFGLRAFPNPAAGSATVAVSLERAQDVRVTLLDVLGREVAVVREGALAAGTTELALPTADLPSGTYLVRLAGEAGARTQTIQVVR
ncbi:MAG TPA: T9SS type A sorting domain-containing protein [Bacteroidetes bacterium]|nr:T9SS type A sorting domain-containing protein [Bacteroidota bacterium]